ncbi:thiamine pyrophosphate-binding protein [Pelagibacterium luteolum]|uniref:Acetolactate synthase-1/2/3 large subunit n=1 Tax=Pelagibacterium luteolum TaxID=440168 RepID=A0A1G7RZN6_9HYPH|nr:thiamine pyrophosphate-binding protein [Pelagibacterium luteolum]SDG16243.1 acetolactate synthase-1/2/3 large subunit [Pelagibacterium luteolum]
MSIRTGGQILVDQLALHGADHVFCVPGESYLAVLDALHDAGGIKTITCRHEGNAAMMAEAHGKLTGRPGICMVTRGPGATNASAGLHVAMQDATPMLLFIGQVARDQIEREAFQEIDYRRMFGQVTKWTVQVDDAARLPELIARAFRVATSGRPGPVAIALPEDMLTEAVDVVDALPYTPLESWPGTGELDAVRALLAGAQRPMVLLGGSPWDTEAVDGIQRFAEANHLPVATSFRRADRFDNAHPLYAGDLGIGPNPKLLERIKAADVLLVIGARLTEMTTGGYTVFDIPVPQQTLIHIHPDPEELGRVYHPTLAINATPREFAKALGALEPIADPVWAGTGEAAHAEYGEWQICPANPGAVQLGRVMEWLEANMPVETIYTNGAGNFSVWLHRFHRYRRLGTQLAPTSGSMGYGFPAAIAAAIVKPDAPVVCFAGDGDFLMSGQDLATAMATGAKPITIIFNNGILGTIRMHQENHYPGRISATDLVNPDFAAYAKAFGAHGETVTETAQFAPAMERALASGTAAIIDLKLDPQAITPRTTLDKLRQAAQAKGL